MDTSATPDKELQRETVREQRKPGYRCPGRQRDGNFALSVGNATGCFTGPELRRLAEIVEQYGKAVHVSTAQSLLIVGIPAEHYEKAREAVLEAGFTLRSVGRDVRHVKCCAGAEYSAFGMQQTFPLVLAIEESFRGLPTPMPFKTSVAGCANCCGSLKLSEFGAQGTRSGWKVFAGGKMGSHPAVAELVAEDVAAEDVLKYLAAVLRVYRRDAQGTERLSRMIARVGFDAFKKAVLAEVDTPHDDLLQEAQEARERAMAASCVHPPHSG